MASAQAEAMAAIHAEGFDAPWSAETLETLLSQIGVIAEIEADGFILIRAVADEAEILTLAVRPNVRRTGIASRLVQAAARSAIEAGADRLFLEVAEDNAAARGLYGAAGFEAAGRRRGYYARPGGSAVDALLLVLNLRGRLPSP